MRLQGWNYRAAGYYFLTFCTHQRKCLIAIESVIAYHEKTWLKTPTQKVIHHLKLPIYLVIQSHQAQT